MRRLSLGILCLSFAHAAVAQNEPADALNLSRVEPPKFETDVVPILKAYCWKCHGGEGLQADLDLRTLPLMLRGGKNGPGIVAGAAADSRVYQRLSRGEMPPGDALKPTAAHIETLRRWLDAGAKADYTGGTIPARELSASDREWWAFRPPVRAADPAIASNVASNSIDAFLLKQLEPLSLTFSPPADRASWLRRVSLDLTGLPPRSDDLDEFLAADAPDAAERVVDRLLASPHYGERWGRNWLDAAGYVDTIATDNDASIIEEREGIWKYRDYVIRSFNADKPFDRFLTEQIAGDELVDWKSPEQYDAATIELLTATGFLRQAADVTYAPELNTSDIRHQVLYDSVQILSTNLLGLTLHCAQCHDHKFDPVSQAEYYQFLAFLAPAYDPQHWKHSKERYLFDVPPRQQAEIDAHNADMDRQIQARKGEIAQLRAPFEQKLKDTKLAALPEPVRADTKAAVETPAEKRTEIQKYLAEKLGPLLAVSPAEIDQALDEPARQLQAQHNADISLLTSKRKSYGKVQAIWDLGTPRTYLYLRGDFQTPGPEVRPGLPAVLPAIELEAGVGPRAALAKWLTRPDHPLTGRVYVNRVWQSFFGRGIVSTPDNFGISGAMPTHPELLDWLSLEFVRKGWSIKQLQRKIATSVAYRQASQTDEHSLELHQRAEAADPEDKLLWRMPLRRLDSEMVRDSILAASGSLDETLYGPPLPLKPFPDGHVEIDVAKLPVNSSPFRRSLYLFARRNYQLTELSVFDQPVVSHNCTRRVNTAVVLQSLIMLNGAFAVDQAERLGAAVRAATPDDRAVWIEKAYRAILNRSPDTDELSAASEFLRQQAERLQADMSPAEAAVAACDRLCQTLLNANEFLYAP